MFLKRLEAFGFKSFADKTVFEFERGFTAIVGPNGCGKSNVVDAIKWVLGDQSPKSLRGGEMLDIIFNGSAHRKPLNFSEVTLTFDNPVTNQDSGDRFLPLNATEVSVTRRLYRSGDSEYLINKALCRLRDVRELFWDTGVGTNSYSIIEQGKIGQLLEANSKERRSIFEEAAGIHKYKERKKEALRKLERVEQNMARLNDRLVEVEQQLRSVTRQAEKARKAKEISDKLRQTRLDILLHDTFTCQNALREVEGALGGAQDHFTALSGELATAQATTVLEQETMTRLDGELTVAQNKLTESRTKLAGLEASIEFDQRAIEGMLTDADQARALAHEAGQRAAALASEREKAELDLFNDQEALKDRQSSVATITATYLESKAQYDETARLVEHARRESLDLLGRKSQAQHALGQAVADLGGIDYRIRKVRAELTRAEDTLRFVQSESGEIKGRMEEIRRRRESLETEQSGLRALQARTEEEIEKLNAGAQELRNQLEKCRSRLTVLQDLNESGEGLSPGVRAVIDEARAAGDEDVYGVAADRLDVPSRFETAVEVALGLHVETLIAGASATVEKYMARLYEQNLGRATFLVLERSTAHVSDPHHTSGLDRPALMETGCLGRLADLVACEDAFKPVVELLLGDVLVFETAAQAKGTHASDLTVSGWRRVSVTGALFEPNGAVSGGKFRNERLGLIGRRNEIVRLGLEMDALRVRIEALAEHRGFLEKRAQSLARDEERLSADMAHLSESNTELKGLLGAITREEARSSEVRQIAGAEARELDAERGVRAERIQELRDAFEKLEVQAKAAHTHAAEKSAELAQHEQVVQERRTKLEDLKREASTLAARVEGLVRYAQSLSAQFAERRDEADRQRTRGEALDARRTATAGQLAEKEGQRQTLSEIIADGMVQTLRLTQEKGDARGRFEDARGRERAVGSELEKAREQSTAFEHQRIELSLRLNGKVEQARGEFQIDVQAELAARGGPPEVPPEALEQTRVLEERLQRLGPVNLYALDEQQQLEERLGFLKTQSGDLISARESLRDVIARINRRSRKQFQDTFEAVRTHFQEVFRKLFGGGKADLVLEEGEDILEAGIEIMARPPGKEPRSILQLSGGEKALTTIALLFAVFRSRPAPFCILDEVDAPLDEANIGRFNMIVQEFMDRSQFLVITHNKKTMGYADVLYGVTMPEPGVSKRIAIKYQEIERHLDMDQIDRQAHEAQQSALQQASASQENTPQPVPVEAVLVVPEPIPVEAAGAVTA